MSERNRYFEHAMRGVAQAAGLTLTLLISISPLMCGHALRAQASSVGTDSTVPFYKVDAAGLSRSVQGKTYDQLLNELRGEVVGLSVRMTAVEENLDAERAMETTAHKTSLFALFIVVLGISGSFGLQWGIMKRSYTSGIRAGVWTFVIALLIVRLAGREIIWIMQSAALFGLGP